MICTMGAISSRNSLSSTGLSLSGPAALPGLRFCRSLSIPATEILKSSMTGVVFSTPAGKVLGGITPESAAFCSVILQSLESDSGSLAVKTD